MVRAVFAPYHIDSKGKLRIELFAPTPGTNEVSIMRLYALGAPGCKRRAVKLAKPDKHFRGFAVLRAAQARVRGHQVVDSREEFFGHAHLELGCPVKVDGEPLAPEEAKIYQAAMKSLNRISMYHGDPHPLDARWTGAPLEARGEE